MGLRECYVISDREGLRNCYITLYGEDGVKTDIFCYIICGRPHTDDSVLVVQATRRADFNRSATAALNVRRTSHAAECMLQRCSDYNTTAIIVILILGFRTTANNLREIWHLLPKTAVKTDIFPREIG